MQERISDISAFEKYEAKYATFKNSLLRLNEIIDWNTFLPILDEALNKEKKVSSERLCGKNCKVRSSV